MCGLQEDNWWITLLEDATSEPHSPHAFGYRKADSRSLAMRHVNLPNISSLPLCDQWWTAIACGKYDSAAPADESVTTSLAVNDRHSPTHSPNPSTVSDLAVSDLSVRDLLVSPGAASASNAASVSNRLNHSLDSSGMLQMLYAKVDNANPARRHSVQDKDILKGMKRCKKLSFENPERNPKRKSLNHYPV